MTIIRNSIHADLPQICNIYDYHVTHGTGTFELTPPTLIDMEGRRKDVLDKGLPYLVAVQHEKVVGFAYCNWFKPRPAYRFSAENSIYLTPDSIGHGLGRGLLAELSSRAEKVGIRKLIAVIGDSENLSSIGAHSAAGFEQVGVLRSCGWKFNRWLDVILMEKILGHGSATPP
tara:strand:- start:546 stop:1064 length:519 start_codon:yes stop_codon:yes gene_type:complete